MPDQLRTAVQYAIFVFERHVLVVTAPRVLTVVALVLLLELEGTPFSSIFHCFVFM